MTTGQASQDRRGVGRAPIRAHESGPRPLSQDALQFLRSESAKKGWDFNETEEAWRQLAPRAEVYEPWAATMNVKAATQVTTSQLITYLVGGVGWKGAAPCRYDGEFVIDPDPVVARQDQLVLRPP